MCVKQNLPKTIGSFRPQIFICWITFNFKEFQGVAIGNKNKSKNWTWSPKCTNYLFFCQSEFFSLISSVISDTLKWNVIQQVKNFGLMSLSFIKLHLDEREVILFLLFPYRGS